MALCVLIATAAALSAAGQDVNGTRETASSADAGVPESMPSTTSSVKQAEPLDAPRDLTDHWCQLYTWTHLSPDQVTEDVMIQAEVRYASPNASDVLLVWELDDGASVPGHLPDGTFLTNDGKRMNSPMRKSGDVFTVRFPVKAGSQLSYIFVIKRTADDKPAEIVQYDRSSGEAYFTTISVADANEVSEIYSVAVLPETEADKAEPAIKVQVRYRDPLATEVVFVWGLNDWAPAPANPPSGTFLTYDATHMNTPMTRKGDAFVLDFAVMENTRLDYAFKITHHANDYPILIWRHDDRTGAAFTTVLSVAGANETVNGDPSAVEVLNSEVNTAKEDTSGRTEVSASEAASDNVPTSPNGGLHQEDSSSLTTRVIPPSPGSVGTETPMIQVHFQYHNPKARDVVLVWGLNKFSQLPAKRPRGTSHSFSSFHMNTPMNWKDGFFVLDFEVEDGTRLDYAFKVTRTSSGEEVDIWRGDKDNDKPYYTKTLNVATADEVVGPALVDLFLGNFLLILSLGVSVLFAAKLAWHAWHDSSVDVSSQVKKAMR